MADVTFFRVGRPARVSGQQFIRNLQLGIQAEMEIAFRRHKNFRSLVYGSWKGDKPKFASDITLKPGQVIGRLFLQGGASLGNMKWIWLNDGTAVRYATMTPDFSPKTKRRVIGSSAGSGGLAFVNTSRPKPGIEEREWDDEIMLRDRPVLILGIGRGIRRAFEMSKR